MGYLTTVGNLYVRAAPRLCRKTLGELQEAALPSYISGLLQEGVDSSGDGEKKTKPNIREALKGPFPIEPHLIVLRGLFLARCLRAEPESPACYPCAKAKVLSGS